MYGNCTVITMNPSQWKLQHEHDKTTCLSNIYINPEY